MNRDDVVKIALDMIRWWQEESGFAPFTCGYDSTHTPLRGEDIDHAVRLYCPVCGWTLALPRPIAELILDRIKDLQR